MIIACGEVVRRKSGVADSYAVVRIAAAAGASDRLRVDVRLRPLAGAVEVTAGAGRHSSR
jgi:hypothetical protein